MNKTHEKIWNNCLETIKESVNYQSFKTWFEPIVPIKIEENVLTIQVPSTFFYEWLEEHFVELLRKTVKRELGQDGRLEYSIIMDNSYDSSNPYTIKVPSANKNSLKNPEVSLPFNNNSDDNRTIPNPFIIPGLKKINVPSNLIESYSFDNYIEGDCNRLARSAGYAVAKNPGKTSFNPLFLYGNNGLGKTHLANAIGIEAKNLFPEKVVLFVNCSTFCNQFINAVKNHNANDFINFYQMIDVLIIDDIQFLVGKEKTQDIFFNIFNHLQQNSKQIIITADKAPIDIEGIEGRLLSRFKWGLSADLQLPDYETRVAIIQKKLYNEGATMPSDVIEYLACNITTNIREIEGALISMIAQSTLNKKTITLDLAKSMIDKFIKTNLKECSMEHIQKVICDYFHLPIEILNSDSRKRKIVQARQLTMFFAKKMTKASLASIGTLCGNRDHATVLHACKTISNLSETDKMFKFELDKIESMIKI